MIHIPATNTLRLIRGRPTRKPFFGPGFTEDYNEVKRRTMDRDEDVLAEVIRRHVFGGANRTAYVRYALSLPHFVDRLDLELLRRQGVHAASAIGIALGNGAKGLSVVAEPGTAPWPWIHGAVRPTRGGRFVQISPLIGGRIRKIGPKFLVRAQLPETVRMSLAKLRGAMLRDVVSHPHLDGLDIRVTSATTTGNPDPSTDLLVVGTNLRNDDVALGELAPTDFAPLLD